MVSLGDWTWQSDVQGADVSNEDGTLYTTIVVVNATDLKVNDAAQTTYGPLDLNYKALDKNFCVFGL